MMEHPLLQTYGPLDGWMILLDRGAIHRLLPLPSTIGNSVGKMTDPVMIALTHGERELWKSSPAGWARKEYSKTESLELCMC